MSTNPHQLYLLADHVKLSLLERQRAASLNIENKQDGHIKRSLETLREGVQSLESQREEAEAAGDDVSSLSQDISRLQKQLGDLDSQFQGTGSRPVSKPNDPALQADFDAAQSRTPAKSAGTKTTPKSTPKSVRFRDDPSAEDDANRAALFPYRDNPEEGTDQSEMDNQQIHAYHKQVIRDQDEQLDTLGQSIGRQRQLGIEMGNELDEQMVMLEDVEGGVDRHQGTLDRARKRLGTISRRAKDNWSWLTIGILIIILILLIALLKT